MRRDIIPQLTAHGRRLLDRRGFLSRTLDGLSGIALATLLSEDRSLAGDKRSIVPVIDPSRPYAPRQPHFESKVKNVVVVFCAGGLSHVDTFDYKPQLARRDGQPLPGIDRFVSFQGRERQPDQAAVAVSAAGPLREDGLGPGPTHWGDVRFHLLSAFAHNKNQHARSGRKCHVDRVRVRWFSQHGSVGHLRVGQREPGPAGLRRARRSSGYAAIGVPTTGPTGFLPATFQGTPFSSTKPVRYLKRPQGVHARADEATRDALRFLNNSHHEQFPGDEALAARIASYELAARMQLSVPEATAIEREPKHVMRLYGADDPENKHKAAFARNCILARRLIERGVRFVQVFNGAYASEGRLNWDGHSKLKEQYDVHGVILDQPVAGLLQDLKQRGLLESTLVLFCTEFGRMPMFQVGTNGRDHNPFGFTCWLAGAGVKAPFSYGATDEFGFKAVENVLTVHDLHATILHLLGLDHTRLTFYHNGIKRRLTDVHGQVVSEVLA